MSDVSAIPRQPLWGLGADALAKIKEVAAAMSGGYSPNAAPVGKLLELLIGKKPEMLEDAAYGFPPTQGTGMTLGPKQEYAGDVADVIPWGKGAAAAKVMAAKLMEHPAAGLAGMLRPGGMKSLMMSHGISGNLEGEGRDLIAELMHPSLAVTGGGQLKNEFAGGGVLIPKVGAFDPAYSTSSLFNRDAYLARTTDFPGGRNPDAEQRIRNMGLLPGPQSEGSKAWLMPSWEPPQTSTPHMAAIQASPSFRSFAEFENSKKGAGTLGSTYDDVASWSSTFKHHFRQWWDNKYGADQPSQDWLMALRTNAAQGDKEAQRLLKSVQAAPSEYGELKVSGSVPLTGERWAGAILTPAMMNRYGDLLAGRGIPSTQKTIETPGRMHDIADAMQRLAGPVKERSLRVSAGWSPEQAMPPRPQVIEAAKQPPALGAGSPEAQSPASITAAKTGIWDSKEDAMKAAASQQPALGLGALPGETYDKVSNIWKFMEKSPDSSVWKSHSGFGVSLTTDDGKTYKLYNNGDLVELAFGKNIPVGNIKVLEDIPQ